MKINLTKLRELANKTGEGEDHVQKIRNAQEFVYSISPMLIVDLIDEIDRLRGALENIGIPEECWVLAHIDEVPDDFMIRALTMKQCRSVKDVLTAHRERFEE